MSREEEQARCVALVRTREVRDELADAVANAEVPAAELRTALAEAERAYAAVRNEFVRANLRLVVKLAGPYRRRRTPMIDLIQEGSIGLMIAADRFDPSRGVRFCTYAAWWVRHQVASAASRYELPLRVPRNVTQLSTKARQRARDIERREGAPPTLERLASELDVPRARLRIALSSTAPGVSLSAPTAESETPLQDLLVDDQAQTWELLTERRRNDDVAEALASLAPMEADVLDRRFGFGSSEPMTLQAIGAMHNRSRERIRQIQNAALNRLERRLEHHAPTA